MVAMTNQKKVSRSLATANRYRHVGGVFKRVSAIFMCNALLYSFLWAVLKRETFGSAEFLYPQFANLL